MVQRYLDLHVKYLGDADKLLEEGDYPQASEKYWGAVAEMIKVVATERNMRHFGHGDMRRVVNTLSRQTRDPELDNVMDLAEALHANFYEGFMPDDIVIRNAGQVHRLIEKLESLRR